MIYGLVHPDTLEIRYVGKTANPDRRLKSHVTAARKGVQLPVYHWWNKVVARDGHAPSFVRLGEGDSAEEVRWIADLRAQGARLLNCTDGGEGFSPGHRWNVGRKQSPERRAKTSAFQRGRKKSPECREKIGLSNRGQKRTEETKERIGLRTKGRMTPEYRAAHGAKIRGRKHSPETRAKMSASHTGLKRTLSPEARANIAAANRLRRGVKYSPETRAKLSASHTGLKHSPETRAKMRAAQRRRRNTLMEGM